MHSSKVLSFPILRSFVNIRHRVGRRLPILLSVVCLFCSPQSSKAADLGFLAKDGVATADIVTAEKPTRAASLAAKELQKYLQKISGAEFSIGTKPNSDFSNHVFVGPSHFATEHGVTDRGLQKDIFRIVSGKGFLALVGKDKDFKSYPAEAEFTCDNKDPAKSWESGPQARN